MMAMDIPELKRLKCPQNWGFSQLYNIEEKLSKKDPVWNEDVDHDDSLCGIPKYGINVGRYLVYCHLSYEYYRRENYVDALDSLTKADVTDGFIKKYDKAFNHVIAASRAFILCKNESVDEAKKIVNQLVNEEFSDKDEAAFKYIRSRMMMHYGGPEISKQALVLSESTVELVEDEAEFCFNYGVLLSRIRRFNQLTIEPSSIEITMLKRAISLEENIASYRTTLAQSYLDARHTVSFEKKEKCKQLASSIFWNLLEKHEMLSGNEIARCIYNLMKFDFKPELEQYAVIAKKKTDSVLANHYIGSFYLLNKQYKEVLDCFKSDVIQRLPFLAGPALLAQYRLNGNCMSATELNNQVDEWSQMLAHDSIRDKCSFYLSLSQFYLLVMDDIKKASSMFVRAYEYECEKVIYINICRDYRFNYLPILKRELTDCFVVDQDIFHATAIINALPKDITRLPKKPISLSAIKENIL